jgi:hypothetical protein
METVKRDTVWHVKKSYKPQIDSLVTDWIFGANGDSTLHVRDIPSGMLYTAERSHEVTVKVKHTASIGGSPVGHMVFGDDTLQHGIFDMELSLDGTWLPINGLDTVTPSDNIKVGKTIFAPVNRLDTHTEIGRPLKPEIENQYIGDPFCKGLLLSLIIMGFPYFLIARLKRFAF